MEEMTRERLREVAAEIDDGDTTLMLVASFVVGPNVNRIAKLAGLPRPFVAERARRLRENGIWVGDKINVEDAENGPDGFEVVLMALVADGMMETVRG